MRDRFQIGDIVHWYYDGMDYYGEIANQRKPDDHYFDSGYTYELRSYYDDGLYLMDPQWTELELIHRAGTMYGADEYEEIMALQSLTQSVI